MTFEGVVAARIPEPGECYLHVVVPFSPLHVHAGYAGVEAEMVCKLPIGILRRNHMLRLGPGHMREKPLAGTDRFERLTSNLRRRLDIDQALLQLERPVVAQMQAQHADRWRAGGKAKIAPGRPVRFGHGAIEQAIAIHAPFALHRVRRIPG